LRAPELVVEVGWIKGCAPAPHTLEGIQTFLERYARPARGVRLVLDPEIGELAPGVPIPESRILSEAQIHALARRERSQVLPPEAQSIYVLFVPRRAAAGSGPGERGEAFTEESFAVIATDAVRGGAFLAIGADEVERFVVQHELGHLLGLVSDQSHEHAAHCTNPACIMYSEPDLRAVLANWWRAFSGRLPAELDADCERDLERLRDGAQPRASAAMSSGARNEGGTAGPQAASGWTAIESATFHASSSTITSRSL
jgi:hypothetical protein